MNRLNEAKRAQIVGCLVEGNSIRATVRMTGAAKNTVVKLLVGLGRACSEYQADKLRNLDRTLVVQADEIWAFVGCKEKTKRQGADGHGDAWTYIAIDADSKLVITWLVGPRSDDSALDFMLDLAERLPNRVQLTTDGHGMYRNAIKSAFGHQIDYGILVKIFGENQEFVGRYSPAICTSCKSKAIIGDPLESHISTSYVERQNLTLRMQNRRFTRLTNAFSKKLENHEHSISVHYMHYNFCRVHQTLKTTPAVAAGVTDHIWSIEEICGLLSN